MRRQRQRCIRDSSLVRQEIQVLAAEQRSMQEQERQLQGRAERLGADRQALTAPDDTQLQALASQATQAAAANEAAQSQLLQAQEALPALDTGRRNQQQRVNTESSTLADVSARRGALTACLLYTPDPADENKGVDQVASRV